MTTTPVTCDSWESAQVTAFLLSRQVGGATPYYAVEYREVDSPDDMLRWVACDRSTADRLADQYAVAAAEEFHAERQSAKLTHYPDVR